MTRRDLALGALRLAAVGSSLALLGCGRGRSSLRYRLTVEVETPAGLKSGASVLETVFNAGNSFEFSASSATFGQAPVVEFPNGRRIFVLLSNPLGTMPLRQVLSNVLRYPELKLSADDGLIGLFDQANDALVFAVVKPADYPMMVTFDDVRKGTTVKEVDPDNLTPSIGPGYRFRRLTVQVVDADTPLTTGFEQRFPEIAGQSLPFRPMRITDLADQDVAGQLSGISFVERRK